ncbi:MAG: ferrous iron transport protein B [Pirellulaceae bacterium]
MTARTETRSLTVALLGNPNTGKSTVFNALCGMRQRVGNYPGVTVDKTVGKATFLGCDTRIVDVPGCYSLAPTSLDEMIVVDLLLGRIDDMARPDILVCIVDVSNLERNLYLASQILELGLPTVLALNMVDVARDRGLRVNAKRLEEQLGLPVVEIQANRRIGMSDLQAAIVKVSNEPSQPPPSPFPKAFQREVAALQTSTRQAGTPLPVYLVERLLLDASGYLARAKLPGVTGEVLAAVDAARERLRHRGLEIPGVETEARYAWAGRLAEAVITPPLVQGTTWTDRVDRILMHRVLGSILFAAIMILMFQSVFYVAEPASVLINKLNAFTADLIASRISEGALQSLLINGVVEGVGGVLVFLPQIFVLFLFIAILEDCGYMARAAYLMDRLMSWVGLSGKSFIPLLSSFACAVPGIMAARVIESPKDRLLTILIAPLMSCSARLPVYMLLIGAFIPNKRFLGGLLGLRGATLFAMYALGIVVAVVVAHLLRKTVLRGSTPPFIMELPSYRTPTAGVVIRRMFEKGCDFVRQAGTLIFAVSILVWAAAYFPRDPSHVDPSLLATQHTLLAEIDRLQVQDAAAAAEDLAKAGEELSHVEGAIEGTYLRNSFLGRMGQIIEPVVEPLGWDWRIGCAVIASLPAREVVIASLAVIYNLGSDRDTPKDGLRKTLQNAKWDGTSRPVFNVPVALSVMVFFALCAQCASTLAVMRRETNSWRWPLFTFAYMTTLAYVGAWATYQIGSLLIL